MLIIDFTIMKKTTEMLCPAGKKTYFFIWVVIILSCLYILIDPINRYFQEDILGLVSYKSYLYSAQDMFFALCAVIGLLNLTKYPPLGWTLANIAIAGFIVFPIYCLCVGVLFRTNIMDLSCIMPILSFILFFVINKKGCRPKYWYFYLPVIFISTLGEVIFNVYVSRNYLWIG